MKKAIATITVLLIIVSSLSAAFHVGADISGGMSFSIPRPGYEPVEGIEPEYMPPLLNGGLMMGFTFPEKDFAFRLSAHSMGYFTNFSRFSPGEAFTHKKLDVQEVEFSTAFMRYKPLGKHAAYMLGGGIDVAIRNNTQVLVKDGSSLEWERFSLPVSLHADAEVLYVLGNLIAFRAGASAGITPYIHFFEPGIDGSQYFDPELVEEFRQFASDVYDAPYLPAKADIRITVGITLLPFESFKK